MWILFQAFLTPSPFMDHFTEQGLSCDLDVRQTLVHMVYERLLIHKILKEYKNKQAV